MLLAAVLRPAELRLPEGLHLPVLLELRRRLPILPRRLLLLLQVLWRVLAELLLLLLLLRRLPERGLLELLLWGRRSLLLL